MDTMHITNILKGFDPRRVNPIFAVKEPGKEIYHCTDGQHTVVTLAKLAQADLIDEVEHEDWDDFTSLGIKDAGALGKTVLGLARNTRYYFRFKATNSVGFTWSEVNTFLTLAN